MKTLLHYVTPFACGIAYCCLAASTVHGFQLPPVEVQGREAGIVESSSQVLNEIMSIPAQGIPRSLLADAQGIAILPRLLKGGFVVGVRHGRGVIVVRDEKGGWRPPSFITMTGGSLGWQAGVESADLVLVFKSKTSVESLLQGKFTIGGGVSAAAGPVGRQLEAGTDIRLQSEIYSYSRTRGLFAGAALDGSKIKVDTQANAQYYGVAATGPGGQVPAVPPTAEKLLREITKYTQTTETPAGRAQLPASQATSGSGALQQELAGSARRLGTLLDEHWRQYLALPTAVFDPDQPLSAEALQKSLSRFDRVATNPDYQTLAQKPEFQQTYTLLKQLCAQQAPAAPIALPPPPMDDK